MLAYLYYTSGNIIEFCFFGYFSGNENSNALSRCNQLSVQVETAKVRSAQCLEEIKVLNEYSARLEKISDNAK